MYFYITSLLPCFSNTFLRLLFAWRVLPIPHFWPAKPQSFLGSATQPFAGLTHSLHSLPLRTLPINALKLEKARDTSTQMWCCETSEVTHFHAGDGFWGRKSSPVNMRRRRMRLWCEGCWGREQHRMCCSWGMERAEHSSSAPPPDVPLSGNTTSQPAITRTLSPSEKSSALQTLGKPSTKYSEGLVNEFPRAILQPVVQVRLNERIIPYDFKKQNSLRPVTTCLSTTSPAQDIYQYITSNSDILTLCKTKILNLSHRVTSITRHEWPETGLLSAFRKSSQTPA